MKSKSKIDLTKIKALYRDALIERVHPERKDCPSPEALVNGLKGKDSINFSNLLEQHIMDCPYCIQEIQFAIRIYHLEDGICLQPKESIEKGDAMDQALIHDDSRKINQPKHRTSYYSLKWLKISAVIAFLSIASLLFFFRMNKLSFQSLRGRSENLIILTSPKSKFIERGHAIFRWERLKNPEYYVIELFDETLRPFWKSPKIHDNQYQLPREVINNLSNDRMYFWMVTAVIADGMEIESRLEHFFLKD